MNQTLTAVVLCGGFSTRMGQDKGLIPAGNSIQAMQVGAKAEVLRLPVLYSIRKEQQNNYAPFIPGASLVTDDTEFEGPLQGLASVHKAFPAKDILLLACDMPEVLDTTLLDLYRHYTNSTHDFYAFSDGVFFQTFCAIYTSKGLEQVLKEKPFSLQQILKQGHTDGISFPEGERFANYNE